MNTIKAKNRILSFALALCLLLGMTLVLPGPVTVSADVGMQEGPPSVTVNATEVVLGGKEWWVIGDESNGVQQASNSLTLLAKNDDFGETQFDTDENRSGTASIAYVGSLLHQKMQSIYDGEDSPFNEVERMQINPVDLGGVWDGDGSVNTNGTLSGQYVWPLSDSEANQSARPITVSTPYWWLRSPDFSIFVLVGGPSGISNPGAPVASSLAVRPAFQLNLSSVIFTSDAVGGKSVTVGSTLSSAAKPQSGAVKLTVYDDDQELEGVKLDSDSNGTGTLTFTYSSATTGTDQYISCVLVDGNDEVAYYGKLENVSSTATGSVDVPLSGVASGDYTLRIFSEQCNGDKETDYAGGIHTFDITVENNNGTFGSSDATLKSVAGQDIAAGSEIGDSSTPKTASITLSSSWSSISDNDLIAANGAKAELYSDNTYATPQSPVTLQDGANELYIKVTSESGLKELYYHVTATRQNAAAPSATIDKNSLQVDETTTLRISLGQSGGAPMATGANITVDDEKVVSVNRNSLNADGDVTVTAIRAGETDIHITFDGVSGYNKTIPVKVTGSGGNGGGSRSSSSSGSSTPDGQRTKTTLPATAFSWDGSTLTIDHDSVTPLGLLTVQWDGKELTWSEDYSVYQGSVIVRFSEDFIAAQAPGNHTIRVEFLNYTGETAVTVGETGLTESNDDRSDNATHNPNTGGDGGGYTGVNDNPNTGDGRGIWFVLLLGSMSAAVLVKLRPRLEVK